MSERIVEVLYEWLTAGGMNSVEDCLEALEDPVSINRELEYAFSERGWGRDAFDGYSEYECLEVLQFQVRDRLSEEVTEGLV